MINTQTISDPLSCNLARENNKAKYLMDRHFVHHMLNVERWTLERLQSADASLIASYWANNEARKRAREMPPPKSGRAKNATKPLKRGEAQIGSAIIYMAAPEEFPEFKDFAKACKPSLGEAWKMAKSAGWYPGFDTAKQWYDWCWQQPDATEINKAYQ